MSNQAIARRPWLVVQFLGILIMFHACVLLMFLNQDYAAQSSALGLVFLSLGLLGAIVSLFARRWLGSSTIAWSSGVKFFGAIGIFAAAPMEGRVAFVAVGMVILIAGIVHLVGARNLLRAEQRHHPFVASGLVNIMVAAVILQQLRMGQDHLVVPMVAGSAFTSGLTLFFFGRLLRKLASMSASVITQLEALKTPVVNHSRVRI